MKTIVSMIIAGGLALAGLGSALSTASFAQEPAPRAKGSTPAARLAGGASALTEQHGSWTVTCQTADSTKRCSLSQQQQDTKTRQRLLAMELEPRSDKTLSGALALPFGLVLGSGVTMTVDDKKIGENFAFRTCLPAGCIVPLTFNQAALAQLKTGTTLKVEGTTSDTNQPIDFTLSLAGFSGALDRTATLAKY